MHDIYLTKKLNLPLLFPAYFKTPISILLTLGSGPTSLATFSLYNTGQRVASDLTIPLVAHYTNNHSSPRSVHNSIQLPLQLVVSAACPEKTAAHKVSLVYFILFSLCFHLMYHNSCRHQFVVRTLSKDLDHIISGLMARSIFDSSGCMSQNRRFDQQPQCHRQNV